MRPFPRVAGELDRALALVSYLREHCDWDRDQTPLSLVPHLLEETHEVVEAIRTDDVRALEGELGDLLLNLAFQVVIAEEMGRFTREDVARGIEDKMIRRHPHLFGGGEREPWEAIKARERREASGARPDDDHTSALDGLVRGLDPLLRAQRIQERAAGVGFDWENPSGALAKVREELREVTEASESQSRAELEEEIGDLLFAVVNLARLSGLHVTSAMEKANTKFARRFRSMEDLARDRDVAIPGASLAALDELWDEIKRRERQGS
ncbi:MAG: nucleoside triphosphate pyrophosphohydrolase [Gemmatimonadota bacterium]